MKIGINCQLLGGLHSGVEYYILGLANRLIRADQQHEFVLFGNRGAGLRERFGQRDNVTIHESHTSALGRGGRIGWEQTVLPLLSRKFRLDVLHCPGYICPVFKTVPLVLTVHDTIALDHPEWCKHSNALYFRALLKRSISTADCVIAVSEDTATSISRHVPGAASKTQVIHSGLDEIFRPVTDRNHLESIRLKYDLPKSFVLFVGNLEPKKNLEGIVLGFQAFVKSSDEATCLAVVGGKTWRMRKMLDALRRADQLENVIFVGYARRDDLPGLYSLAKAFLFPSLHEGFGFPPLEAMACGTPVVASARGALGETLGTAAVLANPCKPSEIARGLRKLFRNRSYRDGIVRAGLARIRQFTWERTAQQTLQQYVRATSARSPTAVGSRENKILNTEKETAV